MRPHNQRTTRIEGLKMIEEDKVFCDAGCGFEIVNEDDFYFLNRKKYCHRCYEEIIAMLEDRGREWKKNHNIN
jgi:hypothetical protein